jgi:hypothetical protein
MSNVTPPYPTPTKPYKAVGAFVASLLIALYFQLSEKGETLNTMNTNEWILTLLAAFAVTAVTYGIPNPAKRSV